MEESSLSILSLSKNRQLPQRFTSEEDDVIKKCVDECGPKHWKKIATYLPGRTARQCRDRYNNYLRPGLTIMNWTDEEDQLLQEKVKELGPKWTLIAQFFNGRSTNCLKNHWNYRKQTKAANKKAKKTNSKTNNLMISPSKQNINNNISSSQQNTNNDDKWFSEVIISKAFSQMNDIKNENDDDDYNYPDKQPLIPLLCPSNSKAMTQTKSVYISSTSNREILPKNGSNSLNNRKFEVLVVNNKAETDLIEELFDEKNDFEDFLE